MRVLTAAALAFLTVAAVRAQQQPTFRSGTSVVPILATVLDDSGRLVPDLERADFTVLDNGKPQEVASVQNDVRPLAFVVTMDFSFSMSQDLSRMRAAAEQFAEQMLPEDVGQVGAFSDKVVFSGRFTSDRAELVQGLARLPAGNPSRFYDAVAASIDLLDNARWRKVVLVFTDGDDTASRLRLGDVLKKAREKDVMVYGIGVQSEFFNGVRMQRSRPSAELRKLADETGGGYFAAGKTTDLASIVARVAHEVHSVYTLGFTPAKRDGKTHKLEIRVSPGLVARAPRSYVASRDRHPGTH